MARMTKDSFTVWCLAVTHGFIDLASSLVVYNAALVHGLTPSRAATLTIVYNIFAFAVQPFAGYIIDQKKMARTAMQSGIVLTLAGVIFMQSNAIVGIASVGIGNALFHVGAGAQILSRYPNSTSAIGIFVGPGALGLSLGFCFGNQGIFPLWFLVIGLGSAYIGFTFLPELKKLPLQPTKSICHTRSQPLILLLLLLVIMIRGFVGRTGFSGLQSDALSIIGLGLAACIGKMAGGVIADRFDTF